MQRLSRDPLEVPCRVAGDALTFKERGDDARADDPPFLLRQLTDTLRSIPSALAHTGRVDRLGSEAEIEQQRYRPWQVFNVGESQAHELSVQIRLGALDAWFRDQPRQHGREA